MTVLHHAEAWVKGEVFQGKLMLAIGAALFLAFMAILGSRHELLRGRLFRWR